MSGREYDCRCPHDLDRVVGERIRTFRRARGLSMKALGADAGVSWQQIQKYELGANRVSVGRAVQIADSLGVGVEDLIDRRSARRPRPLHTKGGVG